MTLDTLRVVQVIQGLGFGGLERVAVTLTLGLAERVERIVVCTSGGDAYRPALLDAGIPIETIPRPKPLPHRLLPAAVAIARVLRRERPHVVHAWNPAAAAAAALARLIARQPGVAIVASYQGVPGRPTSRAARVFGRSSDLVVALAPTATEELREGGLPASRVVTIYNAVAAVPSRSVQEVRSEFSLNGEEVVVSVGRYAEEKNQALLVDAVGELAARRPRLRALLVGEGPLGDQLQARIDERGLDGVMRLTGPRSDAVDIMAAADVFALSSSYEALGVVLLEAMSVGCPVAATAVGGVPDVVRHEETGLLVPPGDRGALASAIERLLDEPELRATVTAAGERLVARKFSPETMVERFAAAYTSAVASRARQLSSTAS